MKFHWLALPGVFVAGCIASDGLRSAALSDNNIWNISRISEGMSEGQVIQIMGKPYDYKTFCAGDDVYDVWFYVTNPSMLGQTRLVKQNLTPLSFKNGVLIGWGYHYYDKVLATQKQTEQRAEPLPEERAPPPALEEKSLEDVLKKTPGAPPAAPVTPKAPPLSQTNALPGRPPEADEPSAIEEHSEHMQNGKPKEQPPAPTPPPKPKKSVSRKTMAMSQSSDSQMPEDAQPQEDEPFDEEGENRLDGESEQDFNFW